MDCRSVMFLTVFAIALGACRDSAKEKIAKQVAAGRNTAAGESMPQGYNGTLAGSYGGPPANVQMSGSMRQRQVQLSGRINAVIAQIGGIEPHFVHAIISTESSYKPGARSHAGAMGLMQMMPGTARRFSVTDAYNVEQSVRGGATYLKWLLNEFGQSKELASAGYNAGEGNVKKYGRRIPPFKETQAYVPRVMGFYHKYKREPHLIGLGAENEPAASERDARGMD